MTSSFPKYNAKNNYSQAVKEIAVITDTIRTVRNIKLQSGAIPSKRVSLYIKTENKKPFINGKAYIEKLAGVEKIEFVSDKKDISQKTVNQVTEHGEIFVPLGELVDFDKEIERLKKELENVESEIKRASGKLSNNGFLDKAPKELVEAEREKYNKYLDIRKKLVNEINDLTK